MYKQVKKQLALLLAAIMAFVCMPLHAQAAAAPAFEETFAVFYENRANKGIYNIQVNNVKKGYILKWHITGKGKQWASFPTKKTIAKTSTVVNKLTVDSDGDEAYAVGERIRITVNVYTAKWKLVNKLTFAGKLQSKAKAIDIDASAVKDLKQVKIGEKQAFKAKMTPANATSKVYWSVKDSEGKDHSKEITEAGVWTPVQAGEYTISVTAKNSPSGQPLCTKEIKATVGSFMESVSQTAADGVTVTFGSAVASEYKDTDFTIKSGEAAILVKKVKYSEDGKTAYITTATNFIDGKKYDVACAGHSKEFTASVGKPVQLSITTSTAQVGRYTTIEYALLDAKGIDVTAAEKYGTFRYSGSVTNGLLDQQTNRLYMTTIGSQASVTLDYISADGATRLTDTKTIVCVAQKADEASEKRFTLTNSQQAPTFKEEDVREIAIGDTLYAHFAAYDNNDAVITYDSISYASSDPDRLIIGADGRITPIKPGAVTIVVTAMQGTYPVTYTFSITVKEARFMAAIQMKETVVAMSNVNVAGYKKEIPVTVKDQYGGNFVLNNETGVITETAGRAMLAKYDAVSNTVSVEARGASVGTYNYMLTLNAGGRSLSQNFTVIVSAPPMYGGAITYQAEASTSTMDLSLDENTGFSKTIDIRLAEYRSGVFCGYIYFNSAEVRKGNMCYDANFRSLGYTTPGSIHVAGNNKLTLTPLSIQSTGNGAYCQKAEAGTYTVTLGYSDGTNIGRTATVSIQLTDGQNPPEFVIQRLTTSAPVQTALQMAVDCIYVKDGSIVECTVTGYSQPGSRCQVSPGQQVHIDTITVNSEVTIANNQKVTVQHKVTVDKTLTNK